MEYLFIIGGILIVSVAIKLIQKIRKDLQAGEEIQEKDLEQIQEIRERIKERITPEPEKKFQIKFSDKIFRHEYLNSSGETKTIAIVGESRESTIKYLNNLLRERRSYFSF